MRTKTAFQPMSGQAASLRSQRTREFRAWLKSMEPKVYTRLEAIIDQSKDDQLVAQVGRDLLDRLHGKATQPIELTEAQKRFQEMSDAELAAWAEAQVKELREGGEEQPPLPPATGPVN